MHVLGMPPAFVLSQDQTLKFIPDPPPSDQSLRTNPVAANPQQGPPNVRTDARKHPAAPQLTPVRPPSAHPFPLLHRLKQQPATTRSQPPSGAALIGPPQPHVNTRFVPASTHGPTGLGPRLKPDVDHSSASAADGGPALIESADPKETTIHQHRHPTLRCPGQHPGQHRQN